MFAILAFMLASQPVSETVTLEGSLVWGHDDRHAGALAYRQSTGQVPTYVVPTDCVSVVGRCNWIGDQVDLFIGSEFKDRLWVCDCAAAQDVAWNQERKRVAEVPFSTAEQWWNPLFGPLLGVEVVRYAPHCPIIPQ